MHESPGCGENLLENGRDRIFRGRGLSWVWMNLVEGEDMADVSGFPPQAKAFRFCPGCGTPGMVVRPDRSILCSSCGFHYYFNTASAVAGIIEDNLGRLLLIVRGHEPKKGTLDLPGGFIDFAETAEDALRREVQEELNLKAGKCTYFGSFPNTYAHGDIIHWTLDLAFVCIVESFEPLALSDEVEKALFFAPPEIALDRVGFDSIRNILFQYLHSMSTLPPCSLP
jgi:NAD+ diphosphatase